MHRADSCLSRAAKEIQGALCEYQIKKEEKRRERKREKETENTEEIYREATMRCTRCSRVNIFGPFASPREVHSVLLMSSKLKDVNFSLKASNYNLSAR